MKSILQFNDNVSRLNTAKFEIFDISRACKLLFIKYSYCTLRKFSFSRELRVKENIIKVT